LVGLDMMMVREVIMKSSEQCLRLLTSSMVLTIEEMLRF